MVFLGISDGRDAAAALVVDDKLVAAVEQERLDRKRHSGAFPSAAIDAVLDQAGLRARDVDRVVVGGASRPGVPAGVAAALRRTGLHMVGYELIRRQLEPRLRADGFTNATVEVVEQDRAQVNAAYRTQAHETALIVLIDAAADGAAVSVDVAVGGHLQRVFLQSTLATLPGIPGRVAERVGVDPAQLGAFAAGAQAPEVLLDSLRALLGFTGEAFRSARPTRGPDAFDRLAERVGPESLAAAAVSVVEEAVAAFVAHHVRRHRVDRVVLAGTLFLDPRLSGRVARVPEVAHLSVCPGPGGAAAALGAALGSAGVSPTATGLLLGPRYDDDACRRALANASLPRVRVDDPDAEAARQVAAGRLVARFAGGVPFGPRSLGARSMLFRPDQAARAVAAKRRPAGVPVGCLLAAAPPSAAELDTGLVAVAAPGDLPRHVDGTILPTVPRDPALLRLLAATGLPGVGETSLNRSGEPMAASPTDAVRAFRDTGCEVLLLGSYLVDTAAGEGGRRQKDAKPTQSSPAR